MNGSPEFFDGDEHAETPQAKLTTELQTTIAHHTNPRNEYTGTLVTKHSPPLNYNQYERFIPLKHGEVTMNLAITCLEKDGDISAGDVHIYLNDPTEHSYVLFDDDGKAKIVTKQGKANKDVWYGEAQRYLAHFSEKTKETDLTLDQLQLIKTILQQGEPDAESLRKTLSENPPIHGRGGMYKMGNKKSSVRDVSTLNRLSQPFTDIATTFCSEKLPTVVDNVFSGNQSPETPNQ